MKMSLTEVSLNIPTDHMANVFGQFDVYIKKMLIERMIDNLNEEKEASSHENTHSGKESKKTGSN